jgi:hypothetical protein
VRQLGGDKFHAIFLSLVYTFYSQGVEISRNNSTINSAVKVSTPSFLYMFAMKKRAEGAFECDEKCEAIKSIPNNNNIHDISSNE